MNCTRQRPRTIQRRWFVGCLSLLLVTLFMNSALANSERQNIGNQSGTHNPSSSRSNLHQKGKEQNRQHDFWKLKSIGRPQFVEFPEAMHENGHILIGSERAVIGLVSAQSGFIKSRYAPSQNDDDLLQMMWNERLNTVVAIVQGRNSQGPVLVRVIEANSGYVLWESLLCDRPCPLGMVGAYPFRRQHPDRVVDELVVLSCDRKLAIRNMISGRVLASIVADDPFLVRSQAKIISQQILKAIPQDSPGRDEDSFDNENSYLVLRSVDIHGNIYKSELEVIWNQSARPSDQVLDQDSLDPYLPNRHPEVYLIRSFKNETLNIGPCSFKECECQSVLDKVSCLTPISDIPSTTSLYILHDFEYSAYSIRASSTAEVLSNDLILLKEQRQWSLLSFTTDRSETKSLEIVSVFPLEGTTDSLSLTSTMCWATKYFFLILHELGSSSVTVHSYNIVGKERTESHPEIPRQLLSLGDYFTKCFVSSSGRQLILSTYHGDVVMLHISEKIELNLLSPLWTRHEALAEVSGIVFSNPSAHLGNSAKSATGFLARLPSAIVTIISSSLPAFVGRSVHESVLGSWNDWMPKTQRIFSSWHTIGRGIMIILLSSTGKLFGMSADSGGLLKWQTSVPAKLFGCSWTHEMFKVNRNLLAVLSTSPDCNPATIVYYLDIESGQWQKEMEVEYENPVLLKADLETASGDRYPVFVDINLRPIIPIGKGISAKDMQRIQWLNAQKDAAVISGFRCDLTACGLLEWQWKLPVGEKVLLAASSANAGGKLLTSPARVTGGAQVLLKYQNPMAVLVLSERTSGEKWLDGSSPPGPHESSFERYADESRCKDSEDATVKCRSQAQFSTDEYNQNGYDDSGISAYLIDIETGTIYDHVFHLNATGPVAALRRENWFVYSIWNAYRQEQELVVCDLYQQEVKPWFQTRFLKSVKGFFNLGFGTDLRSNFGAKHTIGQSSTREQVVNPHAFGRPDTVRQSFLVMQRVTSIGVTNTEKSLTSRSVLLGLASGHVMQAPKMVLDPRRPVFEYTDLHRAEFLIPYKPIISSHPLFFPGGFATKDDYVPWIRGISSGGVHLQESSSNIVLYGLDVLYVNVAPAGRFDRLSEEFGYLSTFLTVSASIVVLLLTRRIAEYRRLKWKWV